MSAKKVDARQRLRNAGLRVTRQRAAVYELLREIGGHHSADDIVARLRQRGQSVSRNSVYNVVADLQVAGLVMCADVGPGRALYEVSDTWHHHFVCRTCGEVLDVSCLEGQKPCLEPTSDAPGEIDEAQVIFRGVCHDCGSR